MPQLLLRTEMFPPWSGCMFQWKALQWGTVQNAAGADAMECFPVLAISLVDSALGEMSSSAEGNNTAGTQHVIVNITLISESTMACGSPELESDERRAA